MELPTSSYYLRSIGRALEVLDCFDGKAPLTLKEIGKRTGLPESTLFRVLLTLEKHGYLSQAMDGTYQLAPKLRFGWLIEQANALRDKVRPELERLAQRFNETASMAYLYDDRIHVLDSIETFHEIRMSNRIGRVLPPHCSALGKAITAFQDRAMAEQIVEIYGLSRRTDRTITDRARLFDEFAEIRRTGIACDREESIHGRHLLQRRTSPRRKTRCRSHQPLHSRCSHDSRARRSRRAKQCSKLRCAPRSFKHAGTTSMTRNDCFRCRLRVLLHFASSANFTARLKRQLRLSAHHR